MKFLKNYISYRLEILFNCSFTTGTVPDHFKMAKVVPVYKKASPLMVSNYRPISLLSIFNKILERLMYNRLVKYFEKSCTFFDQQFGFRSNHSTVHALILTAIARNVVGKKPQKTAQANPERYFG